MTRFVLNYAFDREGDNRDCTIIYSQHMNIRKREHNGAWEFAHLDNRGEIVRTVAEIAEGLTGDGPIGLDLEPWAAVRAGFITDRQARALGHVLIEVVRYIVGPNRRVGLVGPDDDPAATTIFPMVYGGANRIDPDVLVKLDAVSGGKNLTPLVWDRYANGPLAGQQLLPVDLHAQTEAVARYITQCNGSALIVGWTDAKTDKDREEYEGWFWRFRKRVEARVEHIQAAEVEER